MANLKEIRNRISSIGSTMQITSAMKMVWKRLYWLFKCEA